ncbi:stage II sporulation protein M [Clostridium aestuarii]|uniref:Stage II sporulation protein M n=1 Tax=Clostridium aestuarii TaxID=338193 RepID=A0ABT4CXP8_9CLOT|nr:stage II sporulation protein M [Clostridium aestuarii]
MKNNKGFKNIIEHMQKNLILYSITLLFLCIGIVLGMYTVKYMNENQRSRLMDYFINFLTNIDLNKINNKHIFIEAFKNNIAIILAIWFLGLTMLGIPIILIIDLIKGFTLGFTASFVINVLGSKGLLINLIAIFPQNIIYIPCIIIASAIAMEFSVILLKHNVSLSVKNNNFIQIASYSTMFLLIAGFMIIGFLLEGYIIPNVMKLIV